jgi:hypothetical protein
MLIEKGPDIGDVVTLKLLTSEELIGKLVAETDTHYSLDRPLTLAVSAKGLVMQPWLFTVSDSKPIKLPKDKVIVIANTIKEMSDSYLSQTSGIALASA